MTEPKIPVPTSLLFRLLNYAAELPVHHGAEAFDCREYDDAGAVQALLVEALGDEECHRLALASLDEAEEDPHTAYYVGRCARNSGINYPADGVGG